MTRQTQRRAASRRGQKINENPQKEAFSISAMRPKVEPVDSAQRLAEFLEDLVIVGGTRARLGSGPILEFNPGQPAGQTKDMDPCVPTLASYLYVQVYSRAYKRREQCPVDSYALIDPDPSLMGKLAAANPTQSRWDGGWSVFQVAANGAVHIRKGDQATVAQPGQFSFPGGAGRSPGLGSFVELLLAKESTVQQEGYYHCLGEWAACDYDFSRIARYYFNVDSTKAPSLIELIGTLLNRYAIPYRLKCPVNPQGYERLDGVVLYIARRYVAMTIRFLASEREKLEIMLRDGVPLFTKQILRGCGVADDPNIGESFGQVRCRLVAEAIREGWNGDTDDKLAAVRRRFAMTGLDFEKPHLSKGLTDVYKLDEGATNTITVGL